MSLYFNRPDELDGIIQLIEEECGFKYGEISGNPTNLKKFTNRVNLALDTYFSIAIQASGTWQLDDSNHTKYPFIEADLIANQRDYAFSVDEQGNLIKDIYKVMAKNPNGVYYELYPVDQQSDEYMDGFWDGQNHTGQPIRYDKTANGIFLDCLPNYNWRLANEGSKGIKVFINRESSKFTTTDTTKKPGFPYHPEYFFLKPSFDYKRVNTHTDLSALEKEIIKLEGDPLTGRVGLIAQAYGNRQKDVVPFISGEEINSI